MSRVAFLWHLHQPDYRHPRTGRPVMPWTRLHALRGYRDMILETIEQQLPWTLNLVPVLVDQLLDYADGVGDRQLELSARSARSLTPAELAEVCSTFATGHPAMSNLSPRYRDLRARVEAGELLPPPALHDLQIWSTLAWFGATALRDYPSLGQLRAKDRDFNDDDKAELLRVQRAILQEIPSWFTRLGACSGPTLSTTPYTHPILPLLINTHHARRCLPTPADDVDFAYPQDASLQLIRARSRLRELLGREIQGLWPSEGAVSPEVVALAAAAGFDWLASDEGVLQRSDRQGQGLGGWDLGHGVRGFFRDHGLSDQIGFQAARQPAHQAAAALAHAIDQRQGLVTIALDGENPWEAFADAGAAYRAELVAALRTKMVGLDQAADEPPVGRVSSLHTGSWINADLGVWYGHPDDRQAWRMLAEVRDAAEQAPEPQRSAAIERLLPAEGSDWTWWYGEDFDTPFSHVFDALFRTHLRAAWEALGGEAPDSLGQSIGRRSDARQPPVTVIMPQLERPPTWAQWRGAGRMAVQGGAMAAETGWAPVRFGWGPNHHLWLRLQRAHPTRRWCLHLDTVDLILDAGEQGSIGQARAAAWPHDLVLALPAGAASSVRVEAIDPDGSSWSLPESGSLSLPSSAADPRTDPRTDPRLAWWAV